MNWHTVQTNLLDIYNNCDKFPIFWQLYTDNAKSVSLTYLFYVDTHSWQTRWSEVAGVLRTTFSMQRSRGVYWNSKTASGRIQEQLNISLPSCCCWISLPPLSLSLQWEVMFIHCVSKKRHPFYFCKNLAKYYPISIIFGSSIPEEICNKSMHVYPHTCLLCWYHTL